MIQQQQKYGSTSSSSSSPLLSSSGRGGKGREDDRTHYMRNHHVFRWIISGLILAVFTVMIILSFSSSSTTPTKSLTAERTIFWDDTYVDDWNQFLYHHALSLSTWTDDDDDSDTDSKDTGGRYLKSAAKKIAHAQKKTEKKRMKLASKDEKNDSSASPLASSSLIYLNDTQAFRMIRHSGSDELSSTDDFFHYQNGWEAQVNQAYCAVASSAAVLNSLRGLIELPQEPIYMPFQWATQQFLINNECVANAVHDADIVKYVGLGLGMVPDLLNCFLEAQGFLATGHPIDPSKSTVDDVRELVLSALQEPDSRVVLNYDRGAIGQGPMGHGHWSPIGAYHATTDSFLVMDVAKYKYPPVFVPSINLFHGAATLDACSVMGEHPTPVDLSSHDYTKIMNDLACRPGYRGFVVIRSQRD